MGNDNSKKQNKNLPTANEIKTLIMGTKSQLDLLTKKKSDIIKKNKGDILQHIRENNIDIAKIRMDTIIKEENMISAIQLLIAFCDDIKNRIDTILSNQPCPPDLRCSLDSLLYSSSRLEVEELKKIRTFSIMKYGQSYVTKAESNIDNTVNSTIIEKLSIKLASDDYISIKLNEFYQSQQVRQAGHSLPNPSQGKPGEKPPLINQSLPSAIPNNHSNSGFYSVPSNASNREQPIALPINEPSHCSTSNKSAKNKTIQTEYMDPKDHDKDQHFQSYLKTGEVLFENESYSYSKSYNNSDKGNKTDSNNQNSIAFYSTSSNLHMTSSNNHNPYPNMNAQSNYQGTNYNFGPSLNSNPSNNAYSYCNNSNCFNISSNSSNYLPNDHIIESIPLNSINHSNSKYTNSNLRPSGSNSKR